MSYWISLSWFCFFFVVFFFFFNDTATTEIYTLSLHDALPICYGRENVSFGKRSPAPFEMWSNQDRKSTRLNSSHVEISYAVFCLKKKKKALYNIRRSMRGQPQTHCHHRHRTAAVQTVTHSAAT